MERWMYRGRHADWQRIENDSLDGARICGSVTITLEQADIDALSAHSEPDELLATLVESGLVDGAPSYLDRLTGFMPRYEQAVQWGITEATDLLSFCQHTYLHGRDFDRHPRVHDALVTRKMSGESLVVLDALPSYVWHELKHKHNAEHNAKTDTAR
jgi:hypothetical protein